MEEFLGLLVDLFVTVAVAIFRMVILPPREAYRWLRRQLERYELSDRVIQGCVLVAVVFGGGPLLAAICNLDNPLNLAVLVWITVVFSLLSVALYLELLGVYFHFGRHYSNAVTAFVGGNNLFVRRLLLDLKRFLLDLRLQWIERNASKLIAEKDQLRSNLETAIINSNPAIFAPEKDRVEQDAGSMSLERLRDAYQVKLAQCRDMATDDPLAPKILLHLAMLRIIHINRTLAVSPTMDHDAARSHRLKLDAENKRLAQALLYKHQARTQALEKVRRLRASRLQLN